MCRTRLATTSPLLAILMLVFAGLAGAQDSAAMRLSDIRSGELLMLSDPASGTFQPLPKLATEFDIAVSGMVARASVSQRFRNDSSDWLEAVYVFPLPEDAAVDTLRLRIGERVIEGEIHEREEARQLYEEVHQAGPLTSLVEQERPNLFTTSVANIPPGEEILVEIGYLETLRFEAGNFELRIPLAITPRYIPGDAIGPAEGGFTPNTDRVPDAARITPPVRTPNQPLGNPVALTVALDAGFPVAELESLYHDVATTRDGQLLTVRLAAGEIPADRDFALRWTPTVGNRPEAALFTERWQGADYALVMLMPPPLAALPDPGPREMILVIDTSGSMAGVSIKQAKAAVDLALARLGPDDHLNLVAFDDEAWSLFERPRAATSATIAQARRFVARLQADGGTEMREAVTLALRGAPDPERLRQVVFITDGSVGNKVEIFHQIEERLGDARLFTVGIGSAPNSYFMRKAAEVGRGSTIHIGDAGEVAQEMTALFAKLERPALTGLSVAFPEGAEVYPATVRDLYAGEPVLVHARLENLQGDITLEGRSGGRPWQRNLTLTEAEHQGVAQLWARAKITAFEDLRFLGSDPDVIRLAVIDTALSHRLVSDYTSLVAIEREPVRPEGRDLRSDQVPQSLPQGQIFDAIFGPGSVTFGYPSTATPAGLLWLIGVVLLALAPVLVPFRRRKRQRT